MASHRLFPRALVLVVSGLLAALPAGTGLAAVVPAQVVRADAPQYPTFDGAIGGTQAAAAPAGVVNLAVPTVVGQQPANPDPASVTATAGTAGVQGAAILQSDLTGSTLASTPIDSLHLENLPVQIPLSTIPFSRSTSPKSWQDLLSSTVLAGVPLQNVTWTQLTQLSPAPAGLHSINMGDVDWSGSVLANLPLAAFTFGGTDITTIQIPLEPGEPSTDSSAADRWCYALNQAQAGSCPSAASLAGKSLLGVSIQGAALKDLPLHDIPLHDIDLSTSPLHDIPLHDIVLEVSSLKNLPLHDIDMVNSPLHDIPLHDINLATSPLHDIPLHDIDWVASPLHDIPLHDINLATSPVGAIPLHDIAFADAPLHDIPLHDIDLVASGLGNMPLSAIDWSGAPIGTTLLSQLSIAGGPLDPILLSATANPGNIDACPATCPAGETLGQAESNHEILGTATLADIGATAFGSVTLGQLLAGSSLAPKLGDLRLDLAGPGAPPLTVAGLESALTGSPAPTILLGDLRLDEATGVNALVLGDLSDYLSDPATFDAYLLGDIGTYTDNTGHEITLGELGIWTDNTGADITLGELAQYLDDSVSLADVLLGLVPPAQFPFENFPIASLGLDTPGRSMIKPTSDFLAAYGVGCGATGLPLDNNFSTNLPTCFSLRFLDPGGPPGTPPSDPVVINGILPAGAQFLSAIGQSGFTVSAPQVSLDPDGRQRVTFTIPSMAPNSLESVRFTYENSLQLGSNTVDVEMRTSGGDLLATEEVDGSTVVDAAEPNSPIEDPSIEQSGRSDKIVFPIDPDGCSASSSTCAGLGSTYIDAMVAGYISYPGDLDWYYLPNVRAGSRISADLTNLPLDADLVLYGPPGIATSPTLFPPSTSKLPGLLVEDPGLGVGQAAHSIATQALGDLQLDKGYTETLESPPVQVPPMTPISISQHRGTDPESVGAIAPVDGDYVVAVTGYNGATSNDPYLLRARVTAPPAEATCPARSFTTYGSAGAIPTIAANVNTLFLTDPGRIVATYGQAAEDTLSGQLTDLVNYLNANPQLGVVPAVIPVEAYPGVASAYHAWDANPCSVAAANGVAAQITGVIHSIRAGAPGISYVTILGGDDILPMGRVPDLTRVSNESEYASTFTATNPISAAEAASETLTDDVYGDPNPTPTGDGNSLFVPQMAVGRLVESPTDIGSQLESYVTNKGTLDTKTGLVAGYDFLADGAQAVADRLAAGDGGRTVDDSLIDQPGATPGWSQADLLGKLFPTGGASPLVDSINAHYDHTALEPSAVNAGTSSQLEADSDLVASAAGQLAGHLLFTMGCHAGLSVPDAYVPGTTAADTANKLDWAQALSAAGVSIYVANTGYGIGDTSSVAYSERVMALYAKELDGSLTAGQALVYAKQAYYGSLGAVGVYDLKVLQQVAFYGLPFWYVGAAPTGSTPPPPPTAPGLPGTIGPDPSIGGLQSMPLTVASTFTQKNVTGRGSFWVVNGPGGTTLDPQVTQYEPIQPATGQSVVAPNLTAHGALITALTSHDMLNVNPVLNTPTIDLSASSPEVESGDAAWPASIASITNSTAPYGRAQSLVLVPGQFLGSTSDGTGRQRLFDSVGVSVLYGSPASTDFNPPSIATSSAAAGGSSVTFTVSATDGEGPVARVLAGFHDFNGSWKFVELSLQSDGSWSGVGTASRAFGPTDGIEYFIQAVDAAGNVSTASNKAANFNASTDITPPSITANVSPAPNLAGWSKTAETVTFACSDSGSGIAPGTCPASVNVSTDGSTTVTQSVADRAGNTASATAVVQIDQTAPSISAAISPPPNASGWSSAASETVTFTCSDGGSGLAAACPAPVTVSAEGTTPVSASVTDIAGNTASASVSVKLDRTVPTISASVAPVANTNGWNNGASAKVSFTCGDTGSGIAAGACPPAVIVSTEGVTALNASVSDQAGNLITIVATVRIDRTVPTISAVVSPAPNGSGWSNAASETVTFTCGDTGSGLAASACPAPQTVSAQGSTTVSGTVLDLAGNSATKSVVVKLDRTPPTISATISPSPNSAGWLNVLVAKATVAFSCSDGGSGLASGACPAPVLVSTEGITTVTRSVTDMAGNASSATVTVRIDRTAPVVTLTGYPVNPVCTTTDALSGVKIAASLVKATGRVNGIPVTVATCLGAFDVAGNLALPVVRTYVAPITFSGFQAPVVGPPTVNTGSVSKAYPVKFQLRDAGGSFITALPAVSSTSFQSVSCTTFGTATSALPTGTGSSTSLTYDSKANQYVYTWKTPSTAGCYVLTIGLADGTSYKANFKLK